MRPWTILLGVPFLASAQIQDLATTSDGAQLYFSTAYRQKGTTQPGYVKIFRIDPSGLTLFRQFTVSTLGGTDTNFYLAERPAVSANGSVVAYNLDQGVLRREPLHQLRYIRGDVGRFNRSVPRQRNVGPNSRRPILPFELRRSELCEWVKHYDRRCCRSKFPRDLRRLPADRRRAAGTGQRSYCVGDLRERAWAVEGRTVHSTVAASNRHSGSSQRHWKRHRL